MYSSFGYTPKPFIFCSLNKTSRLIGCGKGLKLSIAGVSAACSAVVYRAWWNNVLPRLGQFPLRLRALKMGAAVMLAMVNFNHLPHTISMDVLPNKQNDLGSKKLVTYSVLLFSIETPNF